MERTAKCRLTLVFFALFFSIVASASPQGTTYQARIVKPDGLALESANVNFKFTVLNPAADCILYSETYSAINMANSGGIITFTLGSGLKSYPSSATSFAQVFDNSTPALTCDAGGPPTFTPLPTDVRKVVMQFNDGAGWQTLPAMSINAVPYSIYSGDSLRLGGVSATNYVRYSTIPTCTASQAIRYDGSSFSCVTMASGGGASSTITSGDVATALGYTPANVSTVSTSFTTVTNSLTTIGTSFSTVTSTLNSLGTSVTAVATSVTTLSSSLAALSSAVSAITSSQWTTSGSTVNYALGNVGIGTNSPTASLTVSGTSKHAGHVSIGNLANINSSTTYSSSTFSSPLMIDEIATTTAVNYVQGISNFLTYAPLVNSSSQVHGLDTEVYIEGTKNLPNATAGYFSVQHAGSGLVSSITGVYSYIGNDSATTVPNFYAGSFDAANNTTGTITNAYGLRSSVTQWAGTITNGYGLYISDVGAINSYGIYQKNSANKNYFAGNIGIGKLNPVTQLDVSGGIRISYEAATCATSYAGTLRYYAGSVEYCNGTAWQAFGTSGAVTSSSIIAALSYTPADRASVTTSLVSTNSNISSVSATVNTLAGTVSSVSSSVTSLAASMAAITSSQWTTSGSTIHYLTGNVGIGKTNPAVALAVSGTIHTTGNLTASGSLFLADGTTAYPSMSFAAASGTGFSQSSNQIQVSTGGAQRMYFNAIGITGLNVGNPLFNTSGAGATTPPYSFVGDSQTGMYRIGAGILGFAVTASETMRMDSSGTVSIGGNVVLGSIPNYVNGGSGLYLSNESGDAKNFFRIDAYNDDLAIVGTSLAGASQGTTISFNTIQAGGGINAATRMRIASNGNVGIGITSPSALLHLASGTSSTSSFKFTSGTLVTTPQAGAVEYDGINLYYTDGASTRRTIAATSVAGNYDNVSVVANAAGNIALYPNNGAGVITVSATTASTNSQTGALVVKGGLGVAGNIYSSGTIITSANIQAASITATSGMITPYIYGSIASGGNIVVDSTTHSTKGNIVFAPTGGNVGIGILTPSSPLHVYSDSPHGITVERTSTMNSHIRYKNASQTIYAGMSPPGNFVVGRNIDLGVTPALVVTASQTVGLGGIETPQTTLDVLGVIRVGNVNATTGADLLYARYGSTSETTAVLGTKYSSGGLFLGYGIKAGSDGTNPYLSSYAAVLPRSVVQVSGDIDFLTASTQTMALGLPVSLTSRMFIGNAGSVGIGTSAPTTKLDVLGAIRMSDDQSTCAAGIKGAMRFNQSASIFELCDGSSWGSIATSDLIPASSTVIMQTCATGWTNTGAVDGGPGNATCNGTACQKCHTASAALVPANSIMLMESCPTGWTYQGASLLSGPTAAAFSIAGQKSAPFATCQSPATNSVMPKGSRLLMATCPASWTTLGDTVGGPTLVGCSGVSCKVCEVPGAPNNVRVLAGGNALASTLAGSDVYVLGGNGGATSGNGGAVYVQAGQNASGTYSDTYLQASGGRVGIGTESPAFSLDAASSTLIRGGVSHTVAAPNYAGTYFSFDSATNTAGLWALNPSSSQFAFYTKNDGTDVGTERMRIDSNGRVGIGTLAATTPLHVANTATTTSALATLETTGASGRPYLKFRADGTDLGYVGYGSTGQPNLIMMNYVSGPAYLGTSSLIRMTIDASGSIGIGTQSPQQKLDVSGTIITSYLTARATDTVQEGGELQLLGAGAYGNLQLDNFQGNFRLHTLAAGKKMQVLGGTLSVEGTGGKNYFATNVGIGNSNPLAELDITGDGRATGTFATWSDVRTKKNIKVIPDSLNKILHLRGVGFDWRTDEFPEKKFKTTPDIGVIAQEVEKVFPEVVKTASDGYKSVGYAQLVAPLIEAVKELYYKITGIEHKVDRAVASIEAKKADKAEVDALKAENAELKSRLERLEKMMLQQQKNQ